LFCDVAVPLSPPQCTSATWSVAAVVLLDASSRPTAKRASPAATLTVSWIGVAAEEHADPWPPTTQKPSSTGKHQFAVSVAVAA
jgi:hypothetical protein